VHVCPMCATCVPTALRSRLQEAKDDKEREAQAMGRQVQQKALEAEALAAQVEKMRKTQAAALGISMSPSSPELQTGKSSTVAAKLRRSISSAGGGQPPRHSTPWTSVGPRTPPQGSATIRGRMYADVTEHMRSQRPSRPAPKIANATPPRSDHAYPQVGARSPASVMAGAFDVRAEMDAAIGKAA